MAMKQIPITIPCLNAKLRPRVQNFHLVWLDENIDQNNNQEYYYSITKLREIVNTVNAFVDVDECVNFINGIKEQKVFIIFSGALGQITLPLIHDISQVNEIYIFCDDKSYHEKWAKNWYKIQGVYTAIDPICKALKDAVIDCDHNLISISLVKQTNGTSKEKLNTLDASFMYTQVLKEIISTIDFEPAHFNQFISYCRGQFIGNNIELQNIDKIEKEYSDHQPIWWYTYECFLFSMLNRALRLMEVDLIIKMGFFLKDLHNNIVELHKEQFGEQQQANSFFVYRGQALSQTDFDKLKQTQGGLLSFNNFLSTSKNVDLALDFAQRTTINIPNLVGVLFVIEIDPTIAVTPFANIKGVSCFQGEEEILFSMQSTFRIGQLKPIDGNNRLWQVNLKLVNDNDPELHTLTKQLHKETSSDFKGWHRLGKLMIKLGHLNKAEELYEILIQQTSDKREEAHLYYMLAKVKDDLYKYDDAVKYYEKSIKIMRKVLSRTHPDLLAAYDNLSTVYNRIGEYSKALAYYEKILEIYQQIRPENHPDLATSYHNIGDVYDKLQEHSKALSYYKKAMEIRHKVLSASHPSLANSHSSMGELYNTMGEYPKALTYHEKALEIRQKTLPADHLDLAISYNNIGLVYKMTDDYQKALFYYEKALEIYQKKFPQNHSLFATCYTNIGEVYYSMGEYLKALSYYERALDIKQGSLPPNHPSIENLIEMIELAKEEL